MFPLKHVDITLRIPRQREIFAMLKSRIEEFLLRRILWTLSNFSCKQNWIHQNFAFTHLFLCSMDAIVISMNPKAWSKIRSVRRENVRKDWETARRIEHLFIGSFSKSWSNAVNNSAKPTLAAATVLCQTEQVKYHFIGSLSIGFLMKYTWC